jgi:hypothetical protein
MWISQGFGNLNELIDWALVPVFGLFRLLWKPIKHLTSRKGAADPDSTSPASSRPVTMPAHQELKSLPELES